MSCSRGRLMRIRNGAWSAVVTLAFVSTAYPQANATQQPQPAPAFKVQVWGSFSPEFDTLVSSYAELRRMLEETVPPLAVTSDPAEFMRAERALARKIRAARKGAEQGAIFTPSISVEFKRVLLIEMDAGTWTAIMDDNPGPFSNRINGAYPKDRPHSTVPATILAVLPQLPDDIQYRFLGRHLILYDLRANLILDRIPYAIQFTEDDH